MNRLHNFIFFIIAVFTLGFAFNVNAVHLSDADGKIPVTVNVGAAHNPVSGTYTISTTAASSNPSTVASVPEVTIVFNNVNPTIESGDFYGIATKTGTLDLTGIDFTEPDNYSFDIFCNGSYESTYTIVVTVRSVVDSNDYPTGDLSASLAYIKKNISATNSSKTNSILFELEAYQGYFRLTKYVEGNTASVSEYFKILVTIDPCTTGRVYPIYYYDGNGSDITDGQINYKGNNINRMPNEDEYGYSYATYICGQDNYVYLKDGEMVEIRGDFGSKDFRYKFVEQDAIKYETYFGDETSTNSKDSGWIYNYNSSAAYAGERYFMYNSGFIHNVSNTSVPTGAYIKYLPYVAILVGAITLGVIIIIINRKKKKNDILKVEEL